MKPASFYVVAEWRLRRNAIGSFVSKGEAEQYLALLPDPRGWHVVPVEQPTLPVSMLTARMRRAGMFDPDADHCGEH